MLRWRAGGESWNARRGAEGRAHAASATRACALWSLTRKFARVVESGMKR
jgi:hypothetical protein